MRARFRFFGLVAFVLTIAASPTLHAEDAAIYQQRNADGSVLLTDRPAAAAVTQRTWRIAPEDAGAPARREAARRDAAAVSARIAQRLEADDRRSQELTLARLRAAELQAQLDAETGYAQPQTVWIANQRAIGSARFTGQAPPGYGLSAPGSMLTTRPATVGIVRGVPMRADGFPVR